MSINWLSGIIVFSISLCCSHAQTDEEIRTISSQIWAADSSRMLDTDVTYNINGPKLFTYVNETKFVGTYASMIALLDNYNPDVTVDEWDCGGAATPCLQEQSDFLDAIMATQPIQLLHQWLITYGLASSVVSEFKSELNQYWFMPYTRSGGPLGSRGFEHSMVGEIKNNEVSGFHSWIQLYLEEKAGDFIYGPYINTCANEVIAFGCYWNGYPKSISSIFIKTSIEVEIAVYTLCLLARVGSACPVRFNGIEQTLTTWDMSGIPTTIGSSWPNC